MSPLKGFPRLRNLAALRTSESVGKSNFDDANRIENSGDRLEDVAVSGKARMAAANGRLLRMRASVVGVKILMIKFTNPHLFDNAHFVEICYVMFMLECDCITKESTTKESQLIKCSFLSQR